MATLEKLCARGVFDPPGYSQIIKVTGGSRCCSWPARCPTRPAAASIIRAISWPRRATCSASVKAHVEAAGGTLNDVVKISTYVTDIRYRMDFRTVRDEFFGQRGPASTFIEVGSLSHPDYMIELEAIAVI